MSTFLHGIGTVQFIDKSAELVDLHGIDITSLAKTGVINYEHKNDQPSQLVGKILKAKKIFSEKDCSDEHELYFWNKVKTPYVYIMAELLDDYCDSAKHVAGILKYDRDKKDQNAYNIIWFSVEGSEIPNTRKGQIITRSIARKVTLTAAPCNQACSVEILDNQKPQIKDDFEEIFKSEQNAIKLFKSGEGVEIYEQYLAKKEAQPPSQGGRPPKDPSSEYGGKRIQAGTNRSGKQVFSHGNVNPYGFNPAEHQHTGEHHLHAVVVAQNPKLGDNKAGRMSNHKIAVASNDRVENRAALSLDDKNKIAAEQGKQLMAKKEKVCARHKKLKKDAPAPAPSPMSTTPPEPNPAAASAMQAGATSGGTSFGEAFSNIKSGLGFGKAEKVGWSSGKVSGDTVHYNHPEYDTVSIQKQPSGEFHVKQSGKLAGLGGVNGKFKTPQEAKTHADKYMGAVSSGKILAPKMQNISSDALLNAKPIKKAQVPGSKYPPKAQVSPTSMKTSVGGIPKFAPIKPMAKALTAGSTNAAPSTLVNGAAYQSENLGKKDWKKRAKQDYENWPHKDKFESFMKARMPHLAEGEIKAIGRTLALKKTIEFEKSLESLVGIEKGWKHAAAGAAALASLAGGHSAHAAQPDSVKYQSISHGSQNTPSSTSTLNTRTFGPYTVKTSYHPTSENKGGVNTKTSNIIHEITHNGTHSPKDAMAAMKEIGAPEGSHKQLLQMKPGGSAIFGNSSSSKSGDLNKSYDFLKKSEKSEPKLGNHFLMSAENPMHPHKNEMKMDHKQTLAHLKSKGFKANEVKGHYGSPETSIMVHDVTPEHAEQLHGIASKLGQDSSIYSNNGKHEMRFHHGENAGKKVHGEGTVYHKEKPADFYTTLPNGKHFTHNFNFDKSLNKSELDEKSLKDIQKETANKWAERAEDAYGRAIKEKSVKWLLDADEFFHESIEHSSLSEDLSTFEKIRARLMPIRKEAFKLLAPGSDS